MQYSKPEIFNTNVVREAVCGGGPSGRPCSKKG